MAEFARQERCLVSFTSETNFHLARGVTFDIIGIELLRRDINCYPNIFFFRLWQTPSCTFYIHSEGSRLLWRITGGVKPVYEFLVYVARRLHTGEKCVSIS